MSLQSVFQYEFNDVNYGLYNGDIVSQFFQSELATKCMYELSLGSSNNGSASHTTLFMSDGCTTRRGLIILL
jgi:hypothetical protein